MTLVQRLEAYGIIFVLLAIMVVGAFFIGKFYGSENQLVAQTKQDQVDFSSGIAKYQQTLSTRETKDDLATQKSQALIAAYDQGLINVQTKLKQTQPLVAKNTDGCPILTDAASVRWNAAEQLLSAGSVDQLTPAAVPGPVPAATGAPAR